MTGTEQTVQFNNVIGAQTVIDPAADEYPIVARIVASPRAAAGLFTVEQGLVVLFAFSVPLGTTADLFDLNILGVVETALTITPSVASDVRVWYTSTRKGPALT